MCPEEHNTEQRDEALERRYNERKLAIQKARRRHAIIRLVLRVVVFLLVVSVSTSVTISTCSKKKASEANITQSEVENTSSEQEKKPQPKLPKSAADMVTPGDVNSHFVAILSLDRGEIIASKSMHERIYPASLTKIMTLLVAFENNENLDKTFTVTNAIIDPLYREEATLAGFVDGEDVTIRDLLYGTVLPSGAEAAEAAAIATSGSVKDFLKLMNNKAEELGLKNTHFANVTGLHDKQNYSTAYDMAVILSEALKHPLCREIMSTYQYTTAPTNKHPSGVPLTSTIFSYMYGTEPEGSDILGGKTGYTDQAGYCIAAFGKADDGSEYICITAKGDSRWPAVYDQINLFSIYAK